MSNVDLFHWLGKRFGHLVIDDQCWSGQLWLFSSPASWPKWFQCLTEQLLWDCLTPVFCSVRSLEPLCGMKVLANGGRLQHLLRNISGLDTHKSAIFYSLEWKIIFNFF